VPCLGADPLIELHTEWGTIHTFPLSSSQAFLGNEPTGKRIRLIRPVARAWRSGSSEPMPPTTAEEPLTQPREEQW